MADARFESVPAVREGLRDVKYLADEGIAGVVFLADRLGKPVLVEGPAGTGKTQLAKSVAEMTGSRLIRLQCYEGLDESKALYEWNYKKQLLRIQVEREASEWKDIEENIFDEEFLLTRPLLEAIRAEELLDLAHFVGVTRPGHSLSDPGLPQGRVSLVEVPAMAISSTDCRERVGRLLPVWYLVPDGVVQYIAKRRLYL